MHTRENRIGKLSRDQTKDPDTQALTALHDRLSQMNPDADVNAVVQLKEKIRAILPTIDTEHALPQKKTPSGKTRVLHMNYTRRQTDQRSETELAHLQFFAETATALGVTLEILTHGNSRHDVETELEKPEYERLEYTITENQNPISKWAEDSVEYLENGMVAVLTPFNDNLLEWAMNEGRRHRWQNKLTQEHLDEALRDDQGWIPLGIRVNASETGIARSHAAQANGQNVGHIRAYIEGGNMITGEDASGHPVILIGKDAIGATANLYQLHDDEVRNIIREDFGLDSIDQVICVEQPGQFHLDMGLLFIGHGVVIVNDSRVALNDAVEMADMVPCLTTTTMAAKLKLKDALEEAAAHDLEEAGIQVIRENLEHDVSYNFFNGEFVEGRDGLTYYITNGGPKDQEERFEALMIREWQVVKNVFFSPKEAAQKSLQERGGIGCRLKGSHQ